MLTSLCHPRICWSRWSLSCSSCRPWYLSTTSCLCSSKALAPRPSRLDRAPNTTTGMPPNASAMRAVVLLARTASNNGAAASLGAWADRLCWQGSMAHNKPLGLPVHLHSSATPSKGQDPESVWSPPNALSLGRGACGPFIAYLIIQEQWPVACIAATVSGATDWLDGHLARRMGLQSVLGSYLDPLGDKLLICSVVSALAIKGLIPTWVAAVVIGRDVALVTGTLLHRWRSLGWRRVTLQEFCKLQAPTAGRSPGSSGETGGQAEASRADQSLQQGSGPPSNTGRATAVPPQDMGVPLMQPLFISKANTVLQLGLVSGCLGQAWLGWPDPASLHFLEVATATTTAASCAAYAYQHFSQAK